MGSWFYEGEIVNSNYSKRYHIHDRAARRDLIELVEKGLLTKEGNKKVQGTFTNKCPINVHPINVPIL